MDPFGGFKFTYTISRTAVRPVPQTEMDIDDSILVLHGRFELGRNDRGDSADSAIFALVIWLTNVSQQWLDCLSDPTGRRAVGA